MARIGVKPEQRPELINQALKQVPLQPSLQANLQEVQALFQDCSDLIQHEITPAKGPSCCLLCLAGLVKKDLVDRDVITPLVQGQVSTDLAQVAAGLTLVGDTTLIYTMGELVHEVLTGAAVLLVDGAAGAISYGLRGAKARDVAEPVSESVIRGPHEGFVETLRFNTALLRRKIHSPALKMVQLQVGKITQTSVVIAYIEGVANPKIVQEVKERIGRIEIDGILESGYLEEFIQDHSYSPFPQVQNTERPDTAAGHLLEGRVAIIIDGTPYVLIVPVVFAQLMQASEDYYMRFTMASAIRILRYIFLIVALLLPSIYIAIITFHQEMLPTALLLSIAASREGIPFPALVEAFIMEVTFEILRESGVRLPKTVGQAVSIVGALVIGDAAVKAGLVSTPMVIVVALTGISSFAIPRYNASVAIRMLRFPLMLLAGTLGMFGIVAGLCGILIHLCALRSFGVPYLAPVAPMNRQGLKDVFGRAPHWSMQTRPDLVREVNAVRETGDLKPTPPAEGSHP